VYTVFLAGNSPYVRSYAVYIYGIRSYTVYIYGTRSYAVYIHGSGQPQLWYMVRPSVVHTFRRCLPSRACVCWRVLLNDTGMGACTYGQQRGLGLDPRVCIWNRVWGLVL